MGSVTKGSRSGCRVNVGGKEGERAGKGERGKERERERERQRGESQRSMFVLVHAALQSSTHHQYTSSIIVQHCKSCITPL